MKIDLSSFIPPDKSSLIRQVLFSILTEKKVEVPYGEDLPGDILSAFSVLEDFGKNIEIRGEKAEITGAAQKPEKEIYCGNSGTVMHVLMGICSFKGWNVRFSGDGSLMSRDHSAFYEAMDLYKKGEFVKTSLKTESAQLKSFHILAMLKNGGELSYRWKTRKNTENLLKEMGAQIDDNGEIISVKAAKDLRGYSVSCINDPSAAFIAVCAGLICDKAVKVKKILDEKLRLVPFEILKKVGYDIEIVDEKESVSVAAGPGTTDGESVVIKGDTIAHVIDEIPFLAYMTARKGTIFSVEDASWLRNKESDRIDLTVKLLSNFFEVSEKNDGFTVFFRKNKKECNIVHSDDHRMEMLNSLVSLDNDVSFEPSDSYRVSFPGFIKMISFLRDKNG